LCQRLPKTTIWAPEALSWQLVLKSRWHQLSGGEATWSDFLPLLAYLIIWASGSPDGSGLSAYVLGSTFAILFFAPALLSRNYKYIYKSISLSWPGMDVKEGTSRWSLGLARGNYGIYEPIERLSLWTPCDLIGLLKSPKCRTESVNTITQQS
jgi:hypothetical protein